MINRGPAWSRGDGINEPQRDALVAVIPELSRFDPGRGPSFTQFARHLHRKRTQDRQRQLDTMTRAERDVATAAAQAQAVLGDADRDEVVAWVARALNVPEATVRKYLDRPPVLFVANDDPEAKTWLRSHGPSPEGEATENARAAVVRDAIAELPQKQREVAELLLAGLSKSEIAGRLGLTPGAITLRVKLMQAAMLKKLAARGVMS